MKKSHLKNLYIYFYEFIWSFLLILPFLIILFSFTKTGNLPDLYTYLNSQCNFSSSFIFTSISALSTTIFNVSNNIINWFCAYYVYLVIVHISVDIILFIPKICEKIIWRLSCNEI